MYGSASYINTFEELIRYNAWYIDVIGDCPNLELPVNPEPVFWSSIKKQKGYDCQKNVLTGRCRVVSPSGIRVANGRKSVMLEKMRRLASKDFFEPGDVIGVSRAGLYEHYAIYIGDHRVIHYCGEGHDFGGTISVHEADFSEFVNGSNRCFAVWFDNGLPYKLQRETEFIFNGLPEYINKSVRQLKRRKKVFPAEETVERARSRIGETEYSLVKNNCEHFAMWCKTGAAESSQVKNILTAARMAGVQGYGLDSPAARRMLN